VTAVGLDGPLIDQAGATDVRDRLERAGAGLLMMTMVDNAGVTRVKLVPVSRLETVARSGVGMSSQWAVSSSDDQFAFVPPFDTPSGDTRHSAVRRCPARPRSRRSMSCRMTV
jgi:glutamine synthetase